MRSTNSLVHQLLAIVLMFCVLPSVISAENQPMPPDASQILASVAKSIPPIVPQVGQFLTSIAAGNQPRALDAKQLLEAIPRLDVHIPGVGVLDVSKVPQNVVEDVLKGGQMPGISLETMNAMVKPYLEQVYFTAARALGQDPVAVTKALPGGGADTPKYLRLLSELPGNFLTRLMQGQQLPHMTAVQTKSILDYYIQQLPNQAGENIAGANITELLSPRNVQLMKFLPPGYNMTRLPPQLLKSVAAGETPDVTLLPLDLQQYLSENAHLILNISDTKPEVSIDDIVKELPKFEPTPAADSPYDINKVDGDLVIQKSAKSDYIRLITAISLGLVTTSIVAILAVFFYTKCRRASSSGPTPC